MELTGKNSDSPCTTPRRIEIRKSMSALSALGIAVVCHTGGAGFSFLSVPVMIDVLNIVALIEEIEDSLQ